MRPIRIRKGLDIPIAGVPEALITAGHPVRTVGLLGRDYPGLRPRLRTAVGSRVRLGDVLIEDRRNAGLVLTAPATGVVQDIRLGPRRTLEVLTIGIDEQEECAACFPSFTLQQIAELERTPLADLLLRAGLWSAFRTRPFERVPAPDDTPASIFVTALDTRPLAPDPARIVAVADTEWAVGLRVLCLLTTGSVFLCRAAGSTIPVVDAPQVRVSEFSGPHPAGLVGTHIHRLDPVGLHKTIWHIGYQDVIAIGQLLTTGRVPVEHVVALGGSGVRRPRMVRTRRGASLDDLLADELLADGGAMRVVSGSVLDGDHAAGPCAYLGRYHNQVSVLPEGTQAPAQWPRWSAATPWLRLWGGRRRRTLTTARYGRPTVMVPAEVYERVMPLDVLPVPLLRALLVGDVERAETLGCLELAEEDLALCTFVCPAKIDYGPHLRFALEQLEREG